jgi:hypothetical protein
VVVEEAEHAEEVAPMVGMTLRKTCEACPSQWEGTLADGTPVYVRFRWGHLSVKLNPWTKDTTSILELNQGHGMEGYMSGGELLEHLRKVGYEVTFE